MGQQEAAGETEEAETATGAVDSPWPGRRSIGPPHLHLRRHHGWHIESFFKLLKGAGQQLESWQQETGEAIARRLLVACMACVAVWQLARAQGEQAETLRGLLVRLSGRQMKYGVAFTLPALLAGTWVLLSMLEVLEHHDLDDLRRLAQPLRHALAALTDSG